jgi:hypothetical protein
MLKKCIGRLACCRTLEVQSGLKLQAYSKIPSVIQFLVFCLTQEILKAKRDSMYMV